jgi:hypothetical protein
VLLYEPEKLHEKAAKGKNPKCDLDKTQLKRDLKEKISTGEISVQELINL